MKFRAFLLVVFSALLFGCAAFKPVSVADIKLPAAMSAEQKAAFSALAEANASLAGAYDAVTRNIEGGYMNAIAAAAAIDKLDTLAERLDAAQHLYDIGSVLAAASDAKVAQAAIGALRSTLDALRPEDKR